MIISCPECVTSFNLPDARVTKKGSKVRCSKCRHVFRVRAGEHGEPEIYHKNDGVADPPTQELGDLFEDSAAEEFSEVTQFGAPVGEEESDDDFDNAARRTMIGMPAQTKKSKSASASFDPFPLAGLIKKKPDSETSPETSPEIGIDLFDGEEPILPQVDVPDDPFAGAFDTGEIDSPVLTAQAGPRVQAAPAPAPEPAPIEVPAPVAPAPVAQAAPEDEGLSDIFLGKNVGEFGPADDLVDPTFGQDGAYFDPDAGKVESSVQVAPPPSAARPPRAAAPAPTTSKVAQASSPPVEDWDVEPHMMGGGGFQKFINFLFILVIVLVGCFGYVAFRSDGLLDFKNPEPMVHILMHKAEFEPRPEWQKAAPAPVAAPVKPLVAKHLFANLVPLKEGDLLVVQGTVLNQSEKSKDGVTIRVMILDASEKVLRQETVVAGKVATMKAISELASPADLGSLSLGSGAAIGPKGTAQFMAIISDVPTSVRDNGNISYRVEIAE